MVQGKAACCYVIAEEFGLDQSKRWMSLLVLGMREQDWVWDRGLQLWPLSCRAASALVFLRRTNIQFLNKHCHLGQRSSSAVL